MADQKRRLTRQQPKDFEFGGHKIIFHIQLDVNSLSDIRDLGLRLGYQTYGTLDNFSALLASSIY